MPLTVASWNVAFGSPTLPHEPRRQLLPAYLDAAGYDVLLLQESLPGLLSEEWHAVSSPSGSGRGACVTVACRASLGILASAPLDLPEHRSHCAVAADLIADGRTWRLTSLYVPWRDSSDKWLARLLVQPAMQGSGVVGADLNSPVGPKPSPHPMFETASEAGWSWATMPLLSQGPTMKASQIDHLLVRGFDCMTWRIERHGLDLALSDHAALVAELRAPA